MKRSKYWLDNVVDIVKSLFVSQVAKYMYDGDSMFPEESIDYVTVEQHTGCECMCKVQESDCTSQQEFGEYNTN